MLQPCMICLDIVLAYLLHHIISLKMKFEKSHFSDVYLIARNTLFPDIICFNNIYSYFYVGITLSIKKVILKEIK